MVLRETAFCLEGDLSVHRAGTSRTRFVTAGRAKTGCRSHSTSKVRRRAVQPVDLYAAAAVAAVDSWWLLPAAAFLLVADHREWLHHVGKRQNFSPESATKLGLAQVVEQHRNTQRCFLRQGRSQRVPNARSKSTYRKQPLVPSPAQTKSLQEGTTTIVFASTCTELVYRAGDVAGAVMYLRQTATHLVLSRKRTKVVGSITPTSALTVPPSRPSVTQSTLRPPSTIWSSLRVSASHSS